MQMQDRNTQPSFTMVIFGASGDLTKRKLMPALYELFKENRLNEKFNIIGVGRSSYSDEAYQLYQQEQLQKFISIENQDAKLIESFVAHLRYVTMDPAKEDEYFKLLEKLQQITGENEPRQLLFYLATPPSLYGQIPLHLKKVNLNREDARIIVEKPFGYDLDSAKELNKIYASVFEEEQIYRIDHFLGKETAQNILAFRFANCIFEPIWNRNYIDYVEVTAVESLGIEKRGGFYDGVGALRDMVQNHLIQLVALTAMEPPVRFDADGFRNEVVKVYDSLRPLTQEDFEEHIVRGQYIEANEKKGYRQEDNVNPQSRTETYIAMKIGIDNWRWSGVPFYIRTGKALPTKVTEIVVHFKKTPYQMFHCSKGDCPDANKLIIRIQPNEGILLRFGMKMPGTGFNVKAVDMNFTYDKLGNLIIGDAYARLLEDCIQGDQTLFTRSDAVESSWQFFDPILNYWEGNENAPLYGYPIGTWGPLESEAMMHEHGAEWTNPCKNLINTDQYCEL